MVVKFSDEAITGDSGPEQRPGFRAMLEAAERGEFKVLLLYDGDRLGRFDSLDGAEYWNRLRKAHIRIVTATEGHIDLDSFEGRLVHTVKQEGQWLKETVKLSWNGPRLKLHAYWSSVMTRN